MAAITARFDDERRPGSRRTPPGNGRQAGLDFSSGVDPALPNRHGGLSFLVQRGASRSSGVRPEIAAATGYRVCLGYALGCAAPRARPARRRPDGPFQPSGICWRWRCWPETHSVPDSRGEPADHRRAVTTPAPPPPRAEQPLRPQAAAGSFAAQAPPHPDRKAQGPRNGRQADPVAPPLEIQPPPVVTPPTAAPAARGRLHRPRLPSPCRFSARPPQCPCAP